MRPLIRACSRKGCTNVPRWRPVLLLFPPRLAFPNSEPARATMPLRLCDACKARTTAADMITDQGWRQILQKFEEAGKVLPDRRATRVTFVPLEAVEREKASDDR